MVYLCVMEKWGKNNKPTEERFISMLSDYGFKVTFGNEDDTLFLRRALQALIQSPVPIVNISFDDSTFEGLTRDSRGGIYDIICTDAEKNTYIIEMQVAEYKYLIQRLKFYALHKFNIMVKKGKYKFDNLTKIYCIGFTVENIYKDSRYYRRGLLKDSENVVMDSLMEYITVELSKFSTKLEEITTDLEKLIYLMKNLPTIKEAESEAVFPNWWNEDWIQVAIQELDKKNLSPEKLLRYEMTLAQNAAIVYAFDEKLEAAKIEAKVEATLDAKKKAVKRLLIQGKLNVEEIADVQEVDIDFVLDMKLELDTEEQKV